jgi:hypothetical protein
MSNTSVMLGAMLGLFVLYLASQDRLKVYTAAMGI